MLELSKFDLQLAFPGARAAGKNVEDERSAIEHFAVENFFQIPALSGRKFIVENDGIYLLPAAVLGEFIGFAFADVSAGIRRFEFLQTLANDRTAGGRSQFRQLFQ
jgi:hypothetical protein